MNPFESLNNFSQADILAVDLWTIAKDNEIFLQAYLKSLEQAKNNQVNTKKAKIDLLNQEDEGKKKNALMWIPTAENAWENGVIHDNLIEEEGYITRNQLVNMLRKYKYDPDAIHFIADMLEE